MAETIYCEDCRFYLPGTGADLEQCGRSKNSNAPSDAPVSRKTAAQAAARRSDFYLCSTERMNWPGSCGPAAKFFELKP